MRRLAFAALAVVAVLNGCYSRGWRMCERAAAPGLQLRAPEEVWVIGRPPDPTCGDRQAEYPQGGELRAKVAEKEIPLPLKHTDVKAQIAIWVASVTVRQQYHNPFDTKIEAVYVFPLPHDAAINEFVMTIGERRIRGIIREREEAEKIYLEARRQGHVASLLTQERPNIFTQAVANIEPGQQIDVNITYYHTLRYSDGEYEWHFPTVVGPRFNPPGYTAGVGAVGYGGRGSSGQRIEVAYLRPTEISPHELSLEVDLDAGMPIEGISSPSHVIQVERQGDKAKVRLSSHDRIPNKDFVLRYRVAGREIRGALAVQRDESGGYFTLVLMPPEDLSELPAPPREMVFVLDCSGSMKGEPLAKAKRALKGCLRRLRPEDTFQIIRFSDSASSMGAAPVPATAENVSRAIRFVDSLESEGGTMMIEGVKAALDFPHDSGRFRVVSFLTDGYIGNDREIIAEVKKRLGASRVFTFGIGSSVNRYLLEGMARVGRGACAYVGLDEGSDLMVDEFYRRIEHPALTDLQIDWGAMGVTDVHPKPLPDLFAGRPVALTGRFTGRGETTVRVRGKVGGRLREMTLRINLDAPELKHRALGTIWARSKIADLFEEDRTELWGEIKQLALRYGLVSDWTAFVAVDASGRTRGDSGLSVTIPVPVPDGVRYETTVPERK